MAGTTTKLALYLPGGGSSGLVTPDEQVDVDKINDNMKKIDTAIGFVVCTSGTRPATPFTGQSIIETDTRNTMYWTGARWAPMDTLPNAASSAIRDVLYPTPVAGNQVFRTDIGPGGMSQVYNGTAWRLSASGLIPIQLGTVSGVGAALSASGTVVNLTALTTTGVNLPTIFTTDFDKYRIEIDVQASTTLGNIVAQMSAAAVVETGSNYDVQILSSSAAVAGAGTGLAGTSWPLSGGGGPIQKLTIELNDPALVQATLGIVTSLVTANPMSSGPTVLAIKGMLHRPVTAYSGLQIATSAGTITAGTIRVYGYSN